MIPYIVLGVFAIAIWLYFVSNLVEEAKITKDPQKIKNAKLALLSGILLPVYPVIAVLAVLSVPIRIYRHLGRLNKEENK